MKIDIEKLKKLCKDYDDYYSMYPENKYEGKAVLEYILDRLGVK